MNYSRIMAPNHHYLFNSLPLEPVSRTYQYRKIMKPMLERKRRARINKCLDELKDLMTGTLQADGENVSKLEKADILELTVRHLQRLREHNALFLRADSEAMHMEKFWAGFQHCAVEVTQYLSKYDRAMSGDLVKYIASYIPNMTAAAAAAATASTAATSLTAATQAANYQRFSAAIQEMLPARASHTAADAALSDRASPAANGCTARPVSLREAAGAAHSKFRLHPYAKIAGMVGGGDADGFSDGGVWRPW